MRHSQLGAEPLEVAIPDAHRVEMVVGLEDIFSVVAGLALARAHIGQHRLAIETPGVLLVEPVSDIEHRLHAIAAFERDRGDALEIDGRHLLPVAQVADRGLAQRRVDLERHSRTGAAPIKAEHQAGPLGRAAIDMREDA